MRIDNSSLRLTLFAAVMTMAGCDLFDDDDKKEEPQVETAMAHVRVLHAAPDAPAVNVLVDGAAALTALAYTEGSALVPLTEGSHSVRVDGITPEGDVTVIGPTDLELTGAMEYNVIALGRLAATGDRAFAPLIVARQATEVAADSVRVQILHASPDAPAVDIHVTAPDAELSAPLAANVAFKGYTDPLTVAAASYRVRVTLAGDTNPVFDSGSLALAGGSDLFIAAVTNTDAGSSPVNLVVMDGAGSALVRDVASGAEVRVVHAVDDAPAVDVWIDGSAPAPASPLQGLGFKSVTGYLPLAAGSHDIGVVPSGATTPLVIDAQDVELAGGSRYSLLAVGKLASISDESIEPLLLADDSRRIATEARVRVVHASPDAGEVDVYLTATSDISTAEAVLTAVPFKAASAYLSVAEGDYYVTVTPTGTRTAAIGPLLVSLENAGLLTVAAVTDGSGFDVIVMDDGTASAAQ